MREPAPDRGTGVARLAGSPPAPPPLAVAAALALWGWQADCLPWALAMGTLIEVARFSSLRLDPDQDGFNRLWNLTTLLFLGVGLYLFLAREGLGSVGSLVTTDASSTRLEGLRQLSQTALAFLRAIPFVLFPFVLAHAWSRTGPLPWTTFSILLRARAARERLAFTLPSPTRPASSAHRLRRPADGPTGGTSTVWSESRVHPGFPFLALVLFASGASATRSPFFLPLCAAVVSWALWPWRNPRFRTPTWAGLLLLVLGITFAGQQGLLALRAAWQGLESRLAESSGEGRFNQQRNITALGSVGRIKQSGRIVLRVHTASDRAPGLLREAAFNRFRGNTWTVALRDFQPVVPELDGILWPLSPERRRGESMQIATYSVNGEAPLSLPADALAVRNLTAQILETNVFGAARCQFALPLVTYEVEHGPGGGFDGAPCVDDTDLDQLPWQDQAVIRAVADELDLPSSLPTPPLNDSPATSPRTSATPCGSVPIPDRRTPASSNVSSANPAPAIANTLPPPPCSCSAPPGSPPGTRSVTASRNAAVRRGSPAAAMPTPGAGPTSTGTGWMWTPPPRHGTPRSRTPPAGGKPSATGSPMPGIASPSGANRQATVGFTSSPPARPSSPGSLGARSVAAAGVGRDATDAPPCRTGPRPGWTRSSMPWRARSRPPTARGRFTRPGTPGPNASACPPRPKPAASRKPSASTTGSGSTPTACLPSNGRGFANSPP
ncbi:MAG: hypothetical protein M5U12_36745 [Verrucomicrobia bacterium]|nr:hypothetical protein [Verrucomicrobiota bacterium]